MPRSNPLWCLTCPPINLIGSVTPISPLFHSRRIHPRSLHHILTDTQASRSLHSLQHQRPNYFHRTEVLPFRSPWICSIRWHNHLCVHLRNHLSDHLLHLASRLDPINREGAFPASSLVAHLPWVTIVQMHIMSQVWQWVGRQVSPPFDVKVRMKSYNCK